MLLIFVSGFIYSQNAPTPEMVRQMIAGDIKSLNIEPEKVLKIENQTIENIPIRIYYPNVATKANIIYNIHGGALIAGDLDTHDNISRKIANATNSVVVAIDYKKAPENPFPQSLNDVFSIYGWMLKNKAKLSGKKSSISIVADSGGALFAAALQIQIKQKNVEKIKKIVYINPAFDLRNPGEGIYGLVTKWYLNGADPNNELASPILTKDFSVFAPSLIVVNEKDVLLPQGIEFSEKLTSANVKNEIVKIPGEDHFGGFWSAGHPKVNFAFEKSIAFLKSN